MSNTQTQKQQNLKGNERMIKIHVPAKLNDPFFDHAGDTFRELVECWRHAGFVEIVPTTQSVHVWWEHVNSDQGVILYDRPTMEWWQRAPPPSYKCALFGNTVPKNIPHAWPWIFWGRRPKMLESASATGHTLGWQQRHINSIFLGKIENPVQQAFRDTQKWQAAIQEFHLVVGKQTPYPYTQPQYLEQIAHAKFGLCLRGYGPKCNREIELMAFGTVPIVTPDVDMRDYFEAPQPGLHGHFFVATTPEDVTRIVAETTEAQWLAMSRRCRAWYERNCSTRGSFYQTARLVATLMSSENLAQSILQAWSLPLPKVPGQRRIVIDSVFFERPFSGITRVWQTLLWQLVNSATNGGTLNNNLEFVVLLRANASHIAPRWLQVLSYVAIPAFSYQRMDEDVAMLDDVCSKIGADLFVSTYYTHTRACDCLAVIHDMIPELYRMRKDAMWLQKDRCIANAKWFMCVSETAKRTLQATYPALPTERIHVVPNSFDPNIFERTQVDEALSEPKSAQEQLLRELNVQLPFVLVVASNAENYKNLRLVTEMIRMNQSYLAQRHITFVLVTASANSHSALCIMSQCGLVGYWLVGYLKKNKFSSY